MLCRFFRFVISSAADSGRPVGPVTGRHIARCASCRQFLRSCQWLTEGLRSEAARWERDPGRLSCRISLNPARVRPSHGFPIRVALAAAACIAIAAAATILSLMTPARPPQMPAPTTGLVIPAPAGTQWTTKWVEIIETPLAAEAENLTNDAKSGIRFLAACLDVRPLGADMVPRRGEPGSPPLP